MPRVPATPPHIRSNHEDRDRGRSAPSVETLLRETQTQLDRAGIRMSPSKVNRLCRDYVNIVAGKGVSFGAFLANAVVLDASQRRAFDAVYYRLTYTDPTGETAARNVDRERGAVHV